MNGKTSPPIDFAKPAPTPWDKLWTPAPAEWFTTAPAPRRWLFRDTRQDGSPGVFPLGKAGQIVAAGGVGKTMALVALARAVATGGKWLGAFACGEPGAVLLALGEEDAEEAHRRLYNEARRNGPAPAGSIVVLPLHGLPCAFLETDKQGNPADTAFVSWFRGKLDTRGDWRLVVVDPMSRFAGVDAETNNRLATRYVQTIESLCTPDRCALSSHHTPLSARGGNATEGPRGRGVTGGFDGFRWEAGIEAKRLKLEGAEERKHLGEIVTITFTKSNYGRKPEPIDLRRDDHGALVPLDEIDAATVAEARSGKKQRETRAAEREAERARARAERRRHEDEHRRVREDAAAEELRVRDEGDDGAVRRLVSEQPGRTGVELEGAVCAERGCGTARARRAMFRTAECRPIPGRPNAKGWYSLVRSASAGIVSSSVARSFGSGTPPTPLETRLLVQTSEPLASRATPANEPNEPNEPNRPKTRTPHSAEAKARIAEGMRRKWAERKPAKEGGAGIDPGAPGKAESP